MLLVRVGSIYCGVIETFWSWCIETFCLKNVTLKMGEFYMFCSFLIVKKIQNIENLSFFDRIFEDKII